MRRMTETDEGRAQLRAMKRELEKHACYFDYYSKDRECSPFALLQRNLKQKLDAIKPYQQQAIGGRTHRYWNT